MSADRDAATLDAPQGAAAGSNGRIGAPPAALVPPASLRALAYGALAEAACPVPAPPAEPLELRFLRAYLPVDASDIDARLAAYADAPHPADVPLLALADALRLTPIELLAVTLAAAVEDDLMIGRAIARLQAPIGGSRPTVGLLVTALAAAAPRGVRPVDALTDGAAAASGLLALLAEGSPLPERAVSVPHHLCLALAGRDGAVAGATIGPGDVAPVPLPPSMVREAARQARALAEAPRRTLVLRTPSAMEGRAASAAVARALGRRPLFLEGERVSGLAPWLLLRGLLPVYRLELGPGERRSVPSLAGYDGPTLVLCGPDGSVETSAGTAMSWTLAVPPRAEREQLWQVALPGEGALAAELASVHRHGAGRIAHLGRLVHHRAASAGHARPTAADVLDASWVGEGSGLESLAQPLADRVDDEALVIPPLLRRELELLLLRCRERDELTTGLGVSATVRYRPGVRALFVGESGTGKTLAAGWLATRLGLPLWRVDLASVTSKYIGETEKNLAQLLARAEQAEVVLLFDEADSLFGKRTEVREANDRFANAQTNYLLQRIESFDGITLLTSNSRARFDSAFARRLDVVIEFPLPGPEERRALWLSHLGSAHTLTAGEVNQLAARVELCGGHIRNAVLTAAVLARAGGRAIERADVVRGIESELLKLGRRLPAELAAATA